MAMVRTSATVRTRGEDGDDGEEGPVLLTSSCGGHFTELEALADRWSSEAAGRHWVVPRTAQTEGDLSDVDPRFVTWVPRVDSRDLKRALRNLPLALRLHRRLRPRLVVTTGAAQAVPHLLAAAMCRTPIVYVESVARQEGPSITGRLAARLPQASLFTQAAPGPGWDEQWVPTDDVFSSYRSVASGTRPVSSALVALGTEHFAFPRLVEQAARSLAGADITWQTGRTAHVLGGVALNRWLPAEQMVRHMRRSSVVVVHGGAGSVLTALAAGKVPVVVPRTAALGEHVDDHQVRMCEVLARRNLAVVVGPDETLSQHHLQRAAAFSVAPVSLVSEAS